MLPVEGELQWCLRLPAHSWAMDERRNIQNSYTCTYTWCNANTKHQVQRNVTFSLKIKCIRDNQNTTRENYLAKMWKADITGNWNSYFRWNIMQLVQLLGGFMSSFVSSTSEMILTNFLPQDFFFGIGKANASVHDNINSVATFITFSIITDSGSGPQSVTHVHEVVFFMLQTGGVVFRMFCCFSLSPHFICP